MTRIETSSLSACLAMAHPRNPKEHGIDELIASFKRFGFVAPPTVDEKTMTMVAGHGRCLALQRMRDAGVPPPRGIEERDGDWLVPLVRGIRFESAAERDAYVIADNQHTIRGGWDLDKLRDMMDTLSGVGFDGMGFDALDISSLVSPDAAGVLAPPGYEGNEPPPSDRPTVREHDAPELPRVPTTKLGDVWTLGRHRLACYDALDGGVAMALDGRRCSLTFTDPPWGVGVVGGSRAIPREERIAAGNKTLNNDARGEGFKNFLYACCRLFAQECDPGVPIYVKMSDETFSLMDLELRRLGFHWSSTVVWAKQSLILSQKDFHPQHELIWYGWREGKGRIAQPSDRSISDTWFFDRPRASPDHPTPTPVGLIARAIESSSNTGDLVLDMFGGSGTTLIAAEQLGRTSALVELEPAFCDVIVERWQTLTGGSATRQ